MTALDEALKTIDGVAEEGDLRPPEFDEISLEGSSDPITLPDGRQIFPPLLHGEPVHEVACRLLDHGDPSRSKFARLVGPPGTGKSQVARLIAYHRWTSAGGEVEDRAGVPFYGLVELQPGPSSDEFFFRYDYVPLEDGGVAMVDAAFVQAMRNGWTVMIDEVNTARDVALLSINATLDGRLSLYLPATGETVVARPGFAVLIAYNPGLVGATDIPDAWRSRFPATLEISSNWAGLRGLGVDEQLVKAAKWLDGRRIGGDDGLVWTPQFRDIEALWDMTKRVGPRAGLALYMSGLHEQVETGAIQAAEAAAVCQMLDLAGFSNLRVAETSAIANLHGYPRAVTS